MTLSVDESVILDVLTERKPWFEDSAATLSVLESRKIKGFIAAHAVTTLHFLIEKNSGRKKARSALLDLLKLVDVATVDQAILLKALSLAWDDFEDAVQGACAVEIGADHFITRNASDFEALSIPVHSPAEFVALMAATESEVAGSEED